MPDPTRFSATDFGGITPEMLAAFRRDGVLVLDGLVVPAACQALIARMDEIIAGFDADSHRTVFSTTSRAHDQEAYFLDSGREVRFFFEEGAFDAEGNLRVAPRQALNKVGHALHDRDPLFREFSRQPAFRAIAEGLGLAAPLLLQSMYIFKPPRIGGEVVCHQDSTYLWTEPQSCIGIWLALEDATVENGCLVGLPGLHREAGPRARMRRAEGGGTETEVFDAAPWPEGDGVAIEAPRGSVVVLHGQLPHRSGPNLSDKSREAYTLHLIDGACAYPADNWLNWPADDPITGF